MNRIARSAAIAATCFGMAVASSHAQITIDQPIFFTGAQGGGDALGFSVTGITSTGGQFDFNGDNVADPGIYSPYRRTWQIDPFNSGPITIKHGAKGAIPLGAAP